jgi:non-ribosomal peptide synthetase component E (peptide arylation enzyme)
MILGDGGRGPTLDDVFRRAGVSHPHALALVDPPDCERIAGRPPRALTFSQADRAISAFAATLRGVGLHADTVVGLQLPNTVESVIAFLGVLRAGMIAAPLPLLWRQRDLVEALGRAGAKVIVTCGRIGDVRHAELAMQVAAELFPIRYICAFGSDGADGVLPLDPIFDDQTANASPAPHREHPGAHVAALTFETRVDGLRVFARSHAQFIAAGSKLAAECGLARDGALLSTIPLSSFAGLSTSVVPWLLGGGTLHLHHGFAADAFAAQCRILEGGAAIVPAAILPAISGALGSAGGVIALWRAPERMQSALPHRCGVVDIACFGEAGLLLTQRDAHGAILPLPFGHDTQRTKQGTLALRASCTELDVFPPAENAIENQSGAFIDTGFHCQADPDRGTLTITGGPPGLSAVGGYRFPRRELDSALGSAASDATIAALPDALLGERLAGYAPDPDRLESELTRRGLNPLIATAFRPRGRHAG